MKVEHIQIKGRLEYLGWRHPWNVFPTDDVGAELGPIDVKPFFWTFAERHKGQLCAQDHQRGCYVLKPDTASEMSLDFDIVGAGILLVRADGGFGFSNVSAYLDTALMFLNGQHVIFAPPGEEFRVAADTSHPVFGVKRHGDGNLCKIPTGKETEICKPGTPDCCLFLIMGGGGFECAKFCPPTARMLLARKVEGSIRATRIGDCEVLGGPDDSKAAT